DPEQRLVLRQPVVVVPEPGEPVLERAVLPAARDPAGRVDDPERAQRLTERELRAIELAEELVARDQLLAAVRHLGLVAAREQPEILHRWSHTAIVEVDQERAVGAPERVPPVQVAVDALRARLREQRLDGVRDLQREIAI